MNRRLFSSTRATNATAAWAAGALAVATAGTGCSFIFSEGAPEGHRQMATFGCGESYAPMVTDAIVGGAAGLIAASAAANRDTQVAKAMPEDQPALRHDTNVAVGVLAVMATMLGASAVYGYVATDDCREAKATLAVEVARARVLPPPYGLAPTGEPPALWPPTRAAPAPAPPAPTPVLSAPTPAQPAAPYQPPPPATATPAPPSP